MRQALRLIAEPAYLLETISCSELQNHLFHYLVINIEASCVLPFHRFHKSGRTGIILCVLLAKQFPHRPSFTVYFKCKLIPPIGCHLYYVWRCRYKITGKCGITAAVWGLSALRVILCLMPQNEWTSSDAPLFWGICRNIPFALLGLLVIILTFKSAKQEDDSEFRFLWLTIVLSFGFYIPVVLWADAVPLIGMLMIPKTCAYVWTVLIGFNSMRNADKNEIEANR